MLDLYSDLFLVVFFVGGFSGIGFGFVFCYGGMIGGSDIIVKLLNYMKGISMGCMLFVIDVIVFVVLFFYLDVC